MRHKISILIIFFGTLSLIACTNHSTTDIQQANNRYKQVSYDMNIGDSSAFRMAIVKSIAIPFNKIFDTMIVESQWKICGEIPSDFTTNYPEPNIDKHPFADTLSKLLNLNIISYDAFDNYMEVVLNNRFKGNYPESLYDTCLADNIHLNVVAKRLKDNSFLVITNYRTIDTTIRVDNIFVRHENDWVFGRVEPGPLNR